MEQLPSDAGMVQMPASELGLNQFSGAPEELNLRFEEEEQEKSLSLSSQEDFVPNEETQEKEFTMTFGNRKNKGLS